MRNISKEEEKKLLKRILLSMLLSAPILLPIIFLLNESAYLIMLEYENVYLFGLEELLYAIVMCIVILIFFFTGYYTQAFFMTKLNLRLPSYPFVISGIVQGDYNINMLNPEKPDWRTFCRADDEKLIIKRKNTPQTFILAGVLLTIGSFFFWLDIKNDNVQMETAGSLVIISLGLINIIYNLIRPTKYIEFNRMEGTIKVTGFMLPFRTRTIPFEKVKVIAFKGNLTLAIPYRILNIWLIGEPTQEWWSFYVWYMDRNRPLPRGTLFAAYQQKDYLRRKIEGFPEPLYPVWGSFSDQMKAIDAKTEKQLE